MGLWLALAQCDLAGVPLRALFLTDSGEGPVWFFFPPSTGTEPRASNLLGRCFTTELLCWPLCVLKSSPPLSFGFNLPCVDATH